jgi:hypothetical protein
MAAQLELVDDKDLGAGAFPAHDARSRMSAVAGGFNGSLSRPACTLNSKPQTIVPLLR